MSVVLIPVTLLCVILGTAIVDTVLIRPVPASVNTLLPGWTYAAASVMKVCLVAGLISTVIAMISYARFRWFPVLGQSATESSSGREEHMTKPENLSEGITLHIGILAVALTSLTPLIGALAVTITQTLMTNKPEGVLMSDFTFRTAGQRRELLESNHVELLFYFGPRRVSRYS